MQSLGLNILWRKKTVFRSFFIVLFGNLP